MLNETEGLTILVAEQNSNIALRYSSRAYVLETGKVALDGVARELRQRDDIKAFYLGRETHVGSPVRGVFNGDRRCADRLLQPFSAGRGATTRSKRANGYGP